MAKKTWRGRPSGAWITARKIVQYSTLVFSLLLLIAAPRSGWPASLLNFVMRLDPLLMLAELLASRVFLLSSALALLLVLFSLVFGRAWCGWLCPLGTLLDLIPLRKAPQPAKLAERREPAQSWRGVKYFLLLVILGAALLGNLTLLFLDPLTLLYRGLTVSAWPALDRIVSAVEAFLYQVPFLAEAVSTFDTLVRPRLLPPEPLVYGAALFWGLFLVGVIALNRVAPRFWCRYLCPLGALLGLFSKLALFRREVGEECKGCTLCSSVCPTGTIDPAKGYASDPSECTMCLDCLESCPRSLVSFNPRLSPASWNEYDPGRRQALLAIGTAALGVALLKAGDTVERTSPTLLRPPGAAEVNPDLAAMTRCIRCAACLRACPTGALQSAVFEAGLAGFGTPLLTPRLGYCDYSCNACGQICPVQAIPPLSLEEKRQAVIGLAVLDRNRCLPWSQDTPCIVCEEMCPLPEKAIQLEVVTVRGADGSPVDLQLPYVLAERCIGCGICEYKCPVSGPAAIQVRRA